MVQYKCRNCGGEVKISSSGGMKCPYCGSKSFMSDKDFKGNEEFRRKFLEFLKAEAGNKEFDYDEDRLWEHRGSDSFVMENGQDLTIKYMCKYDYKGCVGYLAKESAVYVFDNAEEKCKYMEGLSKLVFPEADVKLHRCFPKAKMEITLKDGKEAVAFIRRPNFFPAEFFAPMESEHVAWIISRMENICCALNYSGIEHRGIDATSIWINPITHEGALFGDWRQVRKMTGREDLVCLRKTAIALAMNAHNPIELYRFINSAPKGDAFADFTEWDKVIEEGFGGHKFIKM